VGLYAKLVSPGLLGHYPYRLEGGGRTILNFRTVFLGEGTNAYVLPPTTSFAPERRFTISPSSAVLPQLIAIIQLVLSGRQLYLNYSSSIATNGLASPYLAVIPYMVMTIVNAVANAVVGSYPHIIVLPPRGVAGEPPVEQDEQDERDEYVAGLEPEGIELLAADEHDFINWIQENHPYLAVDTLLPRKTSPHLSEVVSAVFLITLVPLILGLLTRFRLGIASRAAWFLVWLYATPLTLFWAILTTSLTSPISSISSLTILVLVPIALIASIDTTIGTLGGLAVISVGLMESMCQSTTWVIPLYIYAAIGISLFFGSLALGLVSLLWR
jgi:hypothetical protein